MSEKSPFQIVYEAELAKIAPAEEKVEPELLPQPSETPEQWLARLNVTRHLLGFGEMPMDQVIPIEQQAPKEKLFNDAFADVDAARAFLDTTVQRLQVLLPPPKK